MKNSLIRFAGVASILLTSASVTWGQAVLIEEGGRRTQPLVSTSTYDVQDVEPLSGALELRRLRRVGAGISAASTLGQGGLNLELNYIPTDSMMAGIGGSQSFRAVSLQWKHSFSGQYFAPYTLLGLAYWGNERGSGSLETSSPSLLGNYFLTNEEKRTGEFDKIFITPGIGIQYYELKGAYQGVSIFSEVVFLYDVEQGKLAGTGGVGALYYF